MNQCNFGCTNIEDECIAECEEEVSSDTDPNAQVTSDEEEDGSGKGSGTELWLYILIVGVVLLLLICCCLFVYCLLWSRQEIDECPPDNAEHEVMMSNNCTHEIGDCYSRDQYTHCGYAEAAPCQTQPAY